MAKNEGSETKVFTPEKFTPFLQKKFKSSEYMFWKDWVAEWELLTDAVKMLNHLHLLFETRFDWRSEDYGNSDVRIAAIRKEQLLFCLDIANAYDSCLSGVDVARLGRYPVSSHHHVLKAVSLLVKNFFTVGSKSDEISGWIMRQGKVVIDPDVLPKVVSLFKRRGWNYDIPATGKEHENRVLREFMVFLAKLGWRDFSGYGSDYISEEQFKALDAAHPEFIKILVDNREVGYLQSNMKAVTMQDIQVLRDIVFKPSYPGEKMPADIGEALYRSDHKKVAATLHVLETRFKYVVGKSERIERAERKLFRLRRDYDEKAKRSEDLGRAILTSDISDSSIAKLQPMKIMRAQLTLECANLVPRIKMAEKTLAELKKDF